MKKGYTHEDKDFFANMLINMNRFILEQKDYIQKYYKLRKLHGDVSQSLINYVSDGKYDVNANLMNITEDIQRSIKKKLTLDLDLQRKDDLSIFGELFIYKTHPKLKSLTEIFLEKKILRNKDKVKMLECMSHSYVGLFEVVDADSKNGYVYYEDVFTKRKFKVIDVSMSSLFQKDKDMKIYMYNRIITFDDISFGTGMHCVMTSDNKKLMNYIKHHDYDKCSDFVRCLELYDISKYSNTIVKINY